MPLSGNTVVRHVEELAQALARAGVPTAEAARLLETASIAAVHAVALELLTAERRAPAGAAAS